MIADADPIPEIARILFDGGAKGMALAEVAMLWEQLAEALEEMSSEFVSVLSILAEAWQGTAAMAAVTKAMPYALWMATAGLECASNGEMSLAQSGNYETGDADIPQLEEIVETRTELLNSYAANAAAWGMLSGYVAACEGRMEEVTFQTISGYAGYDGGTYGTSVQFPFSPSPLITSVGFQGEAMFAASIADTMARAAAGVMSSAEVDALLAATTAQVAEELGLEPIRMAYSLGLDGMHAAETAAQVAESQRFTGLDARVSADDAQQKSGHTQEFSKDLQQGMQVGQQVGQGVMQGVQQLAQFGQQGVQQTQQMLQQGIQQGTQMTQQLVQQFSQMGGQSAGHGTTFAPTGMTGQYTSGYSGGFGGMTAPMGGGNGGGIRMPSGWGGSAPSLGLSGAPSMSVMKLDAGALRGATPASASAGGSSLSSGGMGQGGVQGVAQAAKKQESQEEQEEAQDKQYQVPDQFADGRVVTPPVIGASERARA